MKQTLREQIEMMLKDLVDRQKFLSQSITDYKLSNQFEDAMKCDIRFNTLETVRVCLVEVLL